MDKNDIRSAIITLHKVGEGNTKIVKELKTFKILYKTVCNVVKRYKETSSISDRPRSGRPKTVQTRGHIKRIRSKVTSNPARSVRKMAKQEGVSNTSMQSNERIVKTDLKLQPFKKVNVQLLSEATRKKRLEQGRLLLCEITGDRSGLILFTNE